MKKVKAFDNIVFEEKGITLAKGTVFEIEEIGAPGVILRDAEGSRWLIDLDTFEKGFDAYGE